MYEATLNVSVHAVSDTHTLDMKLEGRKRAKRGPNEDKFGLDWW